MPTPDERTLAALRLLLRTSHAAGPDALPTVTEAAGRELGARRAVLHVVDYDQTVLVPLTATGDERPVPPVPLDGTVAGRTYREVGPRLETSGDVTTVWLPLVNGTARLGVLQLELDDVEPEDELVTAAADVATMLAELVITRSAYGDVVERARRRVAMTLPAEMQWRLLPPLTFVSERVAIAGVLAPTAEVAGDSFDYAVNGDTAHVAIMDAIGHGLEAAVMATVAVAALRNARRAGLGLVGGARSVEHAVAAHFGPEKFVTGIIAELDTESGRWRWTTCGHPHALLVRGGRVVHELDQVIAPPLGLGLMPPEPPVGEVQLQRGDRILLYTDGVVEARNPDGEFFTPERLAEFVHRESSDGAPIAETLRRLNLAVLAHQHDVLQDDATTVMVEWSGDQSDRSTPPTAIDPARLAPG